MPEQASPVSIRRVETGALVAVGAVLSASIVSPAAGIALAALCLVGFVILDQRPTAKPRGSPVADGGDPNIELVVAIIRPGKLNDVKRALVGANAPSLTVSNVSGRGTQPTETGQWRGSEYIVDLHQKVKVECAVTDDRTAAVVDAIQESAHTGEPGDGKIFVMPVYDACRVSTNERGIEAM